MSKFETLGNPTLAPEFSDCLFSLQPALVDLTVYPDGIPTNEQDISESRVLEMGPVLFLGEYTDETGKSQVRFAFPEAPSMTEFALEPATSSFTPIPPESQKYEMFFHSQGADRSLNARRSPVEPFSMGPVILEGIVKKNDGAQEIVVAYPERPNEPFTMPTDLVTFTPAQKGTNGGIS